MPSQRFTYLGPEGTFAEAALLSIPGAKDAELPPSATVPAALDAVRRGEADGAVVPLENSVEGAVTDDARRVREWRAAAHHRGGAAAGERSR